MEEGPKGLKAALDRIAAEAEQAVDGGYSFIVLSDRAFGPKRVPVSCLLAAGRVHHQLIQVCGFTPVHATHYSNNQGRGPCTDSPWYASLRRG